MTLRAAINAFELANPLYKNATVTFYTVAAGVKTATLADLYSGYTGTAQLANPQKLNSRGQFKQPVYIEEKVIGVVSGISVPGHDTAIYAPPATTFRVQQSTGKLQYSYDGGASWSDSGDFIFFNRGTWVTATDYNRNDIVDESGQVYLCLEGHTAGVFATDLSADKWIAIISFTPIYSTIYTTVAKSEWSGTATGTANALAIAPNTAITSYVTGQRFRFKSGASANTAASTVAVSGLATKAIQRDGAALIGGEIAANQWFDITYDGAAFQLSAIGGDIFQPSGTGAIAATTQEELRDLGVNIKRFGASPSALAAANNSAIQAAIDAAEAAGSGRVRIPSGTFLTSATFTLPSGIEMVGDGISSVISSSYAGDVFSCQGTSAYGDKSNIALRNFKIVRTSNTGDFLDALYVDYVDLENLTLEGADATGYLRLTACRFINIKNCNGLGYAQVAFLLNGTDLCMFATMEGGRFTAATQGVTATGLDTATFTGVTSDSHVAALGGTYGVGFDLEGKVRNVKLFGCVAHSCEVGAFYVEGSGANEAIKIEFHGCQGYGSVNGPGIDLAANFRDIIIIGGSFYSNGDINGNGIAMAGSQHVLISGAQCIGNSGHGIAASSPYFVRIIGCNVEGNNGYGINVSGGSDCRVIACVIDGNAGGTITGATNE